MTSKQLQTANLSAEILKLVEINFENLDPYLLVGALRSSAATVEHSLAQETARAMVFNAMNTSRRQ